MRSYATDPARLESLSQALVYSQYCQSHKTNKADIEKMKSHIAKAVKLELTQRQSYCLTQYYIYNRKMVDIANEIGISPCVVSRHISRAVEKLKSTLPYYY